MSGGPVEGADVVNPLSSRELRIAVSVCHRVSANIPMDMKGVLSSRKGSSPLGWEAPIRKIESVQSGFNYWHLCFQDAVI